MPRNPVADRRCEQVHIGATIPPDAVEFGRAMDRWQRANGRYATFADVLRVAFSLGYRRADRTNREENPGECSSTNEP